MSGEIDWNLPERLRTEDQGADLENELRTAATHACEEGRDERAGMLLEAAEVVEWAGVQLAARELCNGTGKQSPAELHDRQRLEEAAQILDRLKAPTGAALLRSYAGKLPEQSPAELQGDVVAEVAGWLRWTTKDDNYEDRARRLLAAITPLLPGSNYALELRERLEGLTAAAKDVVDWSDREQEYAEKAPQGWEVAEAKQKFREARGRLRTALAALDKEDSDA